MQLTGKGSSGSRAVSSKEIQFLFVLLFFFFFSFSSLTGTALALLNVRARAAVVMDGQTHKILYAKNPNLALKPASTTKLVTAMVVLDKLSPDAIVTVSRGAAYTPSIAPHLIPGERMSVRDLLYFALMRSINGAAVALAEAVSGSESAFTVLMNEKAASLGAKDTRYVNSTGLPAPGQYITASDLALILDGALRYPLIRKIIHTRIKVVDVDGRHFFLRNTDELLWSDDDMIGGKTGYTRAAENCLAFAASRDGCTLVGSLLGERVRGNLWIEGKRLLQKSYLVANGAAPPEIYKSPVVLTAYEPSKRRVWHRRIRRPRKRFLTRRYRRLLAERRIKRHERLLARRKRMLAGRYLHHPVKRRILIKRHRLLRGRSRLTAKSRRRTGIRRKRYTRHRIWRRHKKTVAKRHLRRPEKRYSSLKRKRLRRRVRFIARHYLHLSHKKALSSAKKGGPAAS